jgi:hypothetical protein
MLWFNPRSALAIARRRARAGSTGEEGQAVQQGSTFLPIRLMSIEKRLERLAMARHTQVGKFMENDVVEAALRLLSQLGVEANVNWLVAKNHSLNSAFWLERFWRMPSAMLTRCEAGAANAVEVGRLHGQGLEPVGLAADGADHPFGGEGAQLMENLGPAAGQALAQIRQHPLAGDAIEDQEPVGPLGRWGTYARNA